MLPNEEGRWMKFSPTGFLQNVRRAARRRTFVYADRWVFATRCGRARGARTTCVIDHKH